MQPKNKVVLITGGGSGIGFALAKAFVAAGSTVIACGRNQQKLEKAKSALPELNIAVCDVTNDEQIKNLVNKTKEEFGGIDVLVNNAGVFQSLDYTSGEVTMEVQTKEVEIDFMGPIRMIHHFLPELQNKGEAAIVNVSSGLAFVPLAMAPIYCATKAGLHSWTKSLRWQLKDTSVKVFELLPPLVETEMVAGFEGNPMMNADVLASNFIKGFTNNKLEITPGQSSQLKMMSKMAEGFIFKQVNKTFEK